MILTTRAAGLAMCVSLLSPVSTANALQPAPATAQGTDCSSCSYPDAPSSRPSRPPGSGSPSAGGNSTNPAQAIGSMMGVIDQLNRLNAEVEAKKRQYEEQQRAQQAERERLRNTPQAQSDRALWNQWERDGANSAAGATGNNVAPTGDGNPWGSTEKFVPKDPNEDHAGQSCVYFTRPYTDGATFVRSYADNAFVIYGRFAYECVNRHWVNKGHAEIYQNSDKYDAEITEGR